MEEERERLLRAAMSGRLSEVDELANEVGDLPAKDLAVACTLCRADEALPLIAAATDVNQALPPFDWPPLLYLCFSRLQRRPEAAAAPNATIWEAWTPPRPPARASPIRPAAS